jgi:ribosomal protein S18 acetylase RimI-like enzyme
MMVLIKGMKPEDHPALLRLWNRFEGTTTTGADGPESFTSFLRHNEGLCYCALDGEDLIGSVMAGDDGRRGYVYHLAVDEWYQGRGVGRMLMEAVEKSLRNRGVEKAHLFIYRDNPAIDFYRRLGWHLRRDIEVMSKVLIGGEYMGTRLDGERADRE